jgi:hypothetical protein
MAIFEPAAVASAVGASVGAAAGASVGATVGWAGASVGWAGAAVVGCAGAAVGAWVAAGEQAARAIDARSKTDRIVYSFFDMLFLLLRELW